MSDSKTLQKNSINEQSAVKEVVILLTDMVQYSRLTHNMLPEEIRNFIVNYHTTINNILLKEVNQPLSIDPSAGDGAIVIFYKGEGETKEHICRRAVRCAIELAREMETGRIAKTRMGIFLGDIIEAKLGDRIHKFGSSFAVASRLEELCGYFGTPILMDREVARAQGKKVNNLVIVGKITPKNFSSPFNLFTILQPG
ncbi:MAG: adenylate/guanylate cyclase domain-containing protein, partial [Desulfobacteraceae bacterium]|nr:adenylate/guanylate cyclase domain-containing protein [Desulfobacteraceae bacterium]